MSKFANGTEWDCYYEKWCQQCKHEPEEEPADPGEYCPIQLIHFDYDHLYSKNQDIKFILDLLIPVGEDHWPEQCWFFDRVDTPRDATVTVQIITPESC